MAAVCLKKQRSVIPFFPPRTGQLSLRLRDWELVLCSGRLGYIRQRAERRRAGETEENPAGTAGRTLIALPSPPHLVFLYTSTVMHSPLNQCDCTGYTVSGRLWDTTNLCYLQECSRLTSGKAHQLLLLVLALIIFFFFRNSSFMASFFFIFN